jgi:hypothetical protein
MRRGLRSTSGISQDPAIIRARAGLRTAHYRNRLYQRRASSTYALVVAQATALADLQARGYDIVEAKSTLRKLRHRMVDPADRAVEPAEATSAQSTPCTRHLIGEALKSPQTPKGNPRDRYLEA